jgi:hypothetical protein
MTSQRLPFFYSQPIPESCLRSTTRCMSLPVAFSNKFLVNFRAKFYLQAINYLKSMGE